MVRAATKRTIAKIISNGEILMTFPLKIGMRKGFPITSSVSHAVMEVLPSAIGRIRNKSINIKNYMHIFFIHVENPKASANYQN